MREGWVITKLGAISEIFRGGSPRPIKSFITQEADGVNWIKIGDTEVGGQYIYSTEEKIRKEGMRSSRYVEPGDFLLSNSMSFGRPYILKTDGCIHDGWLVIKKYERTLVQDFLYYLLLSPVVAKQFEEGARGSTVRNLNTDIVSSVVVSYPVSHIEQQRIVDILDREFAKIDALKANAEKSLQAAKDLFQATLKKELEPKEGWTYMRLNDIYNFIDYRGATPTKLTEGIPLITAKNIKMGYLDYSIKDFISPEEYKHRQSRGISHRGDILFTTEAPLGNIAIADKDVFSAGQRVITFQQYPNSTKQLNNRFYLYYFLSPSFQETLKEQATGATAQGIKASRLKEIKVPLVDSLVQNSITERLDELNEKCNTIQENYQKTLTLCDDLKQALLRKAFNGEL